MSKKKNNVGDLLASLTSSKETMELDEQKEQVSKTPKESIVNPAIGLATGATVKRAPSVKEPVLQLKHDQVKLFKYHDRHKSSLETQKMFQIRRSIEEEGQHYPGVVRKTSEVTEDGRAIYELIVGRLRFEASRSVGVFLAFLKDLNDTEATKIMFSENEDRQDITPFERWLSIIPIVNDNIMGTSEIARLIGWDKGNLSRSLKAIQFYNECNLEQFLVDVAKVRLSVLIELATLYSEKPDEVEKAISFVEERYPSRKDNLFLKGVIKRVKDVEDVVVDTLFLSGSKVKIKKKGDNLSLTFSGVPHESDFKTIIEKLKEIKSIL